MLRRISRLGLGVALALATFGCAQEREPISRVQPNALKKSFFVGENLVDVRDDPEFYYRGTVVDTGYGAQQDGLFTSTYAMPVSRIKWEVTETMLVARLAYERIADTDGKGTIRYTTDSNGNQVPINEQSGQVVAAFPIQGHFDIRRAYNSVTGEEQNVVEENASDRPWYQREFFRVDWSQNQVTDSYDFDTLSMLGVIGGVKYEPMQYYVNDPTSPDAPVFADGYFDITQKVYAAPQMMELPAIFGGGSFPACFLDADIGGGTAPIANCNPQELKLRLSFRRVVDTDYEAQDWDGIRFQAYGAFTLNFNGRMGYTRPYGLVDDKTHRFIERYNIWQKSHFYDANNQPIVCGTPETEAASTSDSNNNGTADACEAAGAGSRCDLYAKKCTLPFQQRKDRPIVWFHLDGTIDPQQTTVGPARKDGTSFDSANGSKDGLFEPSDWAAQEWDVAMRSARTAARLVECKRTGGQNCDATYPHWRGQMDDQEDAARLVRELNHCRRTRNDWTSTQCDAVVDQKAAEWGIKDAGVIAIAKQQNAVILCHSPVADNDHPECAAQFAPGTKREDMRVRLGDLRYNVVNVINTPQTPSAWGIMVDAKDPLTGENVASSINIWNHVTDIASQGAIDIIRYINGELSTAEITDGKFVKDWVVANQGLAGGSRTVPPMGRDEVLQRLSTVTGTQDPKAMERMQKAFDAYSIQGKLPDDPAVVKEIKRARMIGNDMRTTADLTNSTNAARIQNRMATARGTDFEAQLINPAALQSAGIDTNAVGDQALINEFASPLRRNNQLAASRIRQARQQALADRGACMVEATPEFSSIVGLAGIMKQKFPIIPGENPQVRVERMRRYFARRMHYGVIIHEMGHSFGERHNFVSSYDALSFRPQYWQLRSRNGEVNQPCLDGRVTDSQGQPIKLDNDGNDLFFGQQGYAQSNRFKPKSDEDAKNCIGPRYFDPISNEENEGLLWMWQQSSVMDYPGDVTVDTLGLGAYDFAATRMFYGETTSVYANNGKLGSNINANLLNQTDSDGDGFIDAVEEQNGSDPNNRYSTPLARVRVDDEGKTVYQSGSVTGSKVPVTDRIDDDGDGVLDYYEAMLGTSTDSTADENADNLNKGRTLGDGRPYLVEVTIDGKQQTVRDPGVGQDESLTPRDKDGDGVPDLIEARAGTNPKSAQSTPAASFGYEPELVSAITGRMDGFGGITGLKTGDAHYSQHQARFNLISDCVDIPNPKSYKPADWNPADGEYHETLDARVVGLDNGDGTKRYTRCRQQPVDYVNWSQLTPIEQTADVQTVQGDAPPAVDPQGRIRVPYPFASDNWADTGNVSVFRHDQGADVYEQFLFLMGSQENRHILDHYRRNRTTFAVRPAMSRDFDRYTGKIMNSVKGLGLYRNLYTTDYIGGIWGAVAGGFLAENVLAASLAMDHFSRQLTRPQSGEHYSAPDAVDSLFGQVNTPVVMRSAEDTFITSPQLFDDDASTLAQLQSTVEFVNENPGTDAQNAKTLQPVFAAMKKALDNNPTRIYVPNGTAGYTRDDGTPTGFTQVSFGGRPINNALDRSKGDYSSSYTLNVGSYYEKIMSVMALTESQDNFISASRSDFVDGRYRATSVADVFPEAFRRLIGAALSDDIAVLGPRVAGSPTTLPRYAYMNEGQYEQLANSGFNDYLLSSANKDFLDFKKAEEKRLGIDLDTNPDEFQAAKDRYLKLYARPVAEDTCASGDCVMGEGGVFYPKQPIAWTSWWPTKGPQTCWTGDGNQTCYAYNDNGGVSQNDTFQNVAVTESFPLDPQIGWEVQKYIIAWIYLYLPENNRTEWFDMLRIYRGYDLPELQGAVVKWTDPLSGMQYVAKSYGKENIGGREVEKGIAARVLQRANELTALAYTVDTIDEATGEVKVALDANGQPQPIPVNVGLEENAEIPYVDSLKRYKSIPDFMWQASMAYGLTEGYSPKGIY